MQHHAESSTMYELYYYARARWHQVIYTGGTQQIVSVNYLFGRPLIPSDFLKLEELKTLDS